MKVEKIISVETEDRIFSARAFANEAILEKTKDGIVAKGEATDMAKFNVFLEKGLDFSKMMEASPRINFLPFNSSSKLMASYHATKLNQSDAVHVYASGSPESILAITQDFARKKEIVEEFENFAQRGFRMIAVAEEILPLESNDVATKKEKELLGLLTGLTFLGLVAIRDPIRDDVKETVKEVRGAGIRIIMFTGDHRLTAVTIGQELGFKTSDANIMEGSEIDKIAEKDLFEKISKVEIFSRVDPKHKMLITKLWKDAGESVAVTGDGINDAPALKIADIGIALNSGTDVTKEASDLVLVEDSLSTIANAIKYGRTAYDNIRKVVIYLLSSSFSEIVLVLGSLILHVPLPLTAVQILWTNLVQDGLPNFALAFEKSEEGVMQRKPLAREEPILDTKSKMLAFSFAAVTDLFLLSIFYFFLEKTDYPIEYIRTIIFAALGSASLFYIFSIKSLEKSIFRTNLLDNSYLLFAVGIGFTMMFVAIFTDFFNKVLKTMPLEAIHLVLILLLGVFKIGIMEGIKWFYNRA